MRSRNRSVCALAAAGVAMLITAPGISAQQAVVRSPAPGAQLPWWRPAVIFEVPRAVTVPRDHLRVVIDENDVTEFAEWQGETLVVTSPVPLAEGPHTAELRDVGDGAGIRVLARVAFVSVAPRRRLSVDARASDATSLEAGTAVADAVTVVPHADGGVASSGAAASFDASWNQQVPLEGERAFEAPLVFAELDAGRWRLVGGLTDTDLQADTRLIGSRVYRQVVGGTYDGGRAGTLRAFTNLADGLPSADGVAMRPFWIQNLSWQPRLPDRAGTVTVLAQHASSRSTADSRDESSEADIDRGTLFGAHARVGLGGGWTTAGELVFSRHDAPGLSEQPTDVAARVELTGPLGGHRLELRASRIGTRYRNFADPGLTHDREDAELAVGWQGRRFTYRVRGAISRDGLDGTFARSDQRLAALALSFTPQPGLSVAADIDVRGLDTPGGSRVDTRAVTRLGVAWQNLRVDVHAARSDGDNDRTGPASWTYAKVVGRFGPWRSVVVSGGGGLDRRTGSIEMRSSNLFVEAAFAIAPVASRIAVTLAGDSEVRVGRDAARQWVSAIWSRQFWANRWNLSVSAEGRWQRVRDRLAASTTRGGTALVKLCWNPEWTWSR